MITAAAFFMVSPLSAIGDYTRHIVSTRGPQVGGTMWGTTRGKTMSARRKKREQPLSKQPVPAFITGKVQAPAAVVLGSPAEVCNLVAACPGLEPVCYQMDHFQGARLRGMLAERELKATVEVKPDLWDLPGGYRSAAYLPARRGERELKIDMVEQSWDILADKGTFHDCSTMSIFSTRSP